MVLNGEVTGLNINIKDHYLLIVLLIDMYTLLYVKVENKQGPTV